MKKITAALLVLFFTISLSGCSLIDRAIMELFEDDSEVSMPNHSYDTEPFTSSAYQEQWEDKTDSFSQSNGIPNNSSSKKPDSSFSDKPNEYYGGEVDPNGKTVDEFFEDVVFNTPREDMFYTQETEGGIAITGYKGEEGYIEIPESINGKKVKSVRLEGIEYLRIVKLPSSVTSFSFADSPVEAVNIPESMHYISRGNSKFGTGLKAVFIHDKLNSIDENAFRNCDKLESVIIPESVKEIEDYAFTDCKSLKSIVIPDSVKEIGRYAFADCYNLQTAILPEGLSKISNGMFSCSGITSIKIPDVERISSNAFHGCESLLHVEFSNKTKFIESNAFDFCTSLKSITLPDKLISLGDKTFVGCTSLKNVNASENAEYYSSKDGVLFSKDGKKLVYYPDGRTEKSYSVPETTVRIGGYSFYNNCNIQSVYLPKKLTTIGTSAFECCENLSEINIPESISLIYGDAFRLCTKLKKADLPYLATLTSKDVFEGCTDIVVTYRDKEYRYDDLGELVELMNKR